MTRKEHFKTAHLIAIGLFFISPAYASSIVDSIECLHQVLNGSRRPALEKTLATLSMETIQNEIDQILNAHLKKDPHFPVEEYKAFINRELSATKNGETQKLKSFLKIATSRFIQEAEIARNLERAALTEKSGEILKETKKMILACESQPCSPSILKHVTSRIEKLLKGTCIVSNPIAVANLAKNLSVVWGGLGTYHALREDVSLKDHKLSEFPWDITATASIWTTIFNEVGCRKNLGSVSNPVEELQKTQAVGKELKTMLKNYPGYVVWVPAMSATTTLFSYTADRLRDQDRPALYYAERFAFLTLYDSGPGTMIRIGLDRTAFKAFPYLEKSLEKLVKNGTAAWWTFKPFEGSVRVGASAMQSKLFFWTNDKWNSWLGQGLGTQPPKEQQEPSMAASTQLVREVFDQMNHADAARIPILTNNIQ